MTPLHIIGTDVSCPIQYSKLIVELLISKGADINAKDINYLNLKILF